MLEEYVKVLEFLFEMLFFCKKVFLKTCLLKPKNKVMLRMRFSLKASVTTYDGFSRHFSRIIEIISFALLLLYKTLVHDVDAIYDLCLLLITSGNLF